MSTSREFGWLFAIVVAVLFGFGSYVVYESYQEKEANGVYTDPAVPKRPQ